MTRAFLDTFKLSFVQLVFRKNRSYPFAVNKNKIKKYCVYTKTLSMYMPLNTLKVKRQMDIVGKKKSVQFVFLSSAEDIIFYSGFDGVLNRQFYHMKILYSKNVRVSCISMKKNNILL